MGTPSFAVPVLEEINKHFEIVLVVTQPDSRIRKKIVYSEVKNKAIELGFDIILVSNNSKKRVSEFANKMNFKYIARANKPFKKGYKKAIKLINNQSKEKVIFIGDQLITDIFGANKMEITNLLVNPLKTNTEHWYTKINRCLENSVLKSMRKIDESMYKKIKKGRSNEK